MSKIAGPIIRELTEGEAAGKTVNERPFLSKLLDEFDKAVRGRDEGTVQAILEQIYLTSEGIKNILRLEFR